MNSIRFWWSCRPNPDLLSIETELLLKARGRGITKDLDTVGTPHFAQFIPLEDNQIGFFTVYDGYFDNVHRRLHQEHWRSIRSAIQVHQGSAAVALQEASSGVHRLRGGANRAPIGFYQAYPGLTVQDIKALIADSKT